MKHTVFSLFLALFAFCALPSLSLAANPAAANDSADIALEKALADLRNGSDTVVSVKVPVRVQYIIVDVF